MKGSPRHPVLYLWPISKNKQKNLNKLILVSSRLLESTESYELYFLESKTYKVRSSLRELSGNFRDSKTQGNRYAEVDSGNR